MFTTETASEHLQAHGYSEADAHRIAEHIMMLAAGTPISVSELDRFADAHR